MMRILVLLLIERSSKAKLSVPTITQLILGKCLETLTKEEIMQVSVLLKIDSTFLVVLTTK